MSVQLVTNVVFNYIFLTTEALENYIKEYDMEELKEGDFVYVSDKSEEEKFGCKVEIIKE